MHSYNYNYMLMTSDERSIHVHRLNVHVHLHDVNNGNKSMFPEDIYSKINHQKAWFKLHYYSITCRPTYISSLSNFQFLLRQAFADDEASTRLLQILLFLLLTTASLMFIPCAIRSSFTLSIHFFGCLPLLLVP